MEQRNEINEPLRAKNRVGVLKAKTTQELADEYEISKETLRRWLRPFHCEIGIREGNLYNIKQVEIIYENLGTP